MARIAILSLEHAGHQIPTGCVGLALQRRGHEVTVVAQKAARPLAEQLGLPMAVLPDSPPFRRSLGKRLAALLFHQAVTLEAWRLAVHVDFLCEQAPSVLRDLRTEALIVDQNPLCGATIADHLGLPYATVFSALMGHEEPNVPPIYRAWPYEDSARARRRNRLGAWGFAIYNRPLLRRINRQRAAWGLPPRRTKADHYSPYAQISPLVQELDFPRRELPDVCHYVGSLGADRPERFVEFPWDRLDGRPLIFASVGTVKNRHNASILRTIAAACRGLDAQLVLALGKWNEQRGAEFGSAGDVDPTTIVVDYAPQMALLRKAALLITHAGQNTVMEAISQGVPMVAVPRNADQPGIAARVAYAGAGLVHSPRQLDPASLREKIVRVLSGESFRRRAAELREANARAGGANRAAEIAERAFLERRPVTRQEFEPPPKK